MSPLKTIFALICLCVNHRDVFIFIDGMIVKHFRPKEDVNSRQQFANDASFKPLCTTVKKTTPGMQDGNFITRDPGHWRLLADGSRTYEPQTCTLHRFSSEEARQCLAGHHLLMIGDSMMRFQFLSLAYFIEHGKWEYRFPMSEECQHKDASGQMSCSPWNHPNILTEKDWAKMYGHSAERSWKEMHRFIGGKGFNGHLDCQCLRHDDIGKSTESFFYQNDVPYPNNVASKDDSTTMSGFGIPHLQPTSRPPVPSAFLESIRNQRPSFQPRNNSSQYHSSGKNAAVSSSVHRHLSSGDRSIKLTFLVNLNNSDVRLLPRTNCEENASCHYDDVTRNKILDDIEAGNRWKIKESLTKSLDASLFQILPDVDIAIFNEGLWSLGYPQVEFVSEVMERLYNFTNRQQYHPGRCFWKGTSPAFHVPALKKYPALFAAGDEPYRAAAMKAGCQVFDIAHVTKQFAVFNYQGRRKTDQFEDEQKLVFADAAHFQPWVNEELNQILLNVLC